MVEYNAKAGDGTEHPPHSPTWTKDQLLGVGLEAERVQTHLKPIEKNALPLKDNGLAM